MTTYAERGAALGDAAEQARTQTAMVAQARAIITAATGPLDLAGKIVRSSDQWGRVVYVHVTSVDPGAPTSAMDDAQLLSAVNAAINDLAATEPV